MRAFVSYSLADSELPLISLLFDQLRRGNFDVDSSTANFNSLTHLKLSISTSDIFIGIITNDSGSVKHVVKEWKIAKEFHIDSILVIEEGVKIENPSSIKHIVFNRYSPDHAIQKLFNLNKPKPKKLPSKSNGFEEVVVFTGIIVALAALISMLSGGKSKR